MSESQNLTPEEFTLLVQESAELGKIFLGFTPLQTENEGKFRQFVAGLLAQDPSDGRIGIRDLIATLLRYPLFVEELPGDDNLLEGLEQRLPWLTHFEAEDQQRILILFRESPFYPGNS